MIKDPNSLVTQVFRQNYFQNNDLMDAKLRGSPSFIWRSLWSSLGLVKEGIVWRVGNGRIITIWKEK